MKTNIAQQLKTFLGERQAVADLRKVPDCPYGENQNEPDAYPEPVAGFTYGGSYAISGPYPADGGFHVYLTSPTFERSGADLLSLELDLFWYYGRDGQATRYEPATLADALYIGSLQSDIDSAVHYVQRVLDVPSGDLAAILFSDCNALNSGKSWDELWPTLDPIQRSRKLASYAESELLDQIDSALETFTPETAAKESVR